MALPLVDSCVPLAHPALSDREALELERLFKALADRHRLRIVNLLAGGPENGVCVCDFVPSLRLAQPTVSYHLKLLVDAGLLLRERRRSFVYYRLAPGALARMGILLHPASAPAAA